MGFLDYRELDMYSLFRHTQVLGHSYLSRSFPGFRFLDFRKRKGMLF